MEDTGISIADALALRGNNNTGDNTGFGSNGAWWVIILILFFAFAGWGGNNRGYGSNGADCGVNTVIVPTGNGFGSNGYSACCTPATSQSITDAFNFNQIDNGIRGIQNGLCDGFYSTANNITTLGSNIQQSINGIDRANLQGFNGIQSSICQTGNTLQNTMNQNSNAIQSSLVAGFNDINNGITATNTNISNCCCEQKEAIMQSNFNNQAGFNNLQNQIATASCTLGRGQKDIEYAIAKATCDITANNDRNADRIINHLTQTEMDNLRSELQSAQFQLSQNSQTMNIINRLSPTPQPAYVVNSPYTSVFPQTNNCGCC